jgi:hypothetical protein
MYGLRRQVGSNRPTGLLRRCVTRIAVKRQVQSRTDQLQVSGWNWRILTTWHRACQEQ